MIILDDLICARGPVGVCTGMYDIHGLLSFFLSFLFPQ